MLSNKSGLDAILDRREPSLWQQYWSSPVNFIAQTVHSILEPVIAAPQNGIRVVCISDTHNTQPTIPDGDLLLHAGDLTQSGSIKEVQAQIDWLDSQPHTYKVVIAGNHDLCLDKTIDNSASDIEWRGLIYLKDSSTTLRFPAAGDRLLNIYGSPWTPKHGNWAFQYPRGCIDRWCGKIPEDTDIVMTHGPPKGHQDAGHLGCPFLRQEIWAKRPLLHIFGHIHAGYGQTRVIWDSFQNAYDRVIDDATWINLAKLVIAALSRMSSWKKKDTRNTVMVNAATVGGYRDTQKREAIVVIV